MFDPAWLCPPLSESEYFFFFFSIGTTTRPFNNRNVPIPLPPFPTNFDKRGGGFYFISTARPRLRPKSRLASSQSSQDLRRRRGWINLNPSPRDRRIHAQGWKRIVTRERSTTIYIYRVRRGGRRTHFTLVIQRNLRCISPTFSRGGESIFDRVTRLIARWNRRGESEESIDGEIHQVAWKVGTNRNPGRRRL